MPSTLERPPSPHIESEPELNAIEKKAARIKELMWMSLPTEIVERAKARGLEGNELERELQEIAEARAEMGLQTVIGFHTSDKYITDKMLTGDVNYSTSLQTLYAGKPPKYLYVVEGASNDEEFDTRLHWRHSRGARIKILYGTRLSSKLLEAIEGDFADCEYHLTVGTTEEDEEDEV